MDPKYFLKNIAGNVPYPIGKFISGVPYGFRLGKNYGHFFSLATYYEKANSGERLKYVLEQLNNIVKYASKNIPFYRELYGGRFIEIKSLDDFEKLPVITKTQVRDYYKQAKGAMRLNTGGSSGEPLSFYIDKNAWAREWAHMHYIWGLRGYKYTDLMMTMMGRPIGRKVYRYNAVHNEFLLNPYEHVKEHINSYRSLINRYPIKYFQGYPSTIYNFFKELENVADSEIRKSICKKIKCLLLSSEYPMPYMLEYLKNEWGLGNYISWYGHSEMCVLAYDRESNGTYVPFVTYGFAEEVDSMLIGTSFHNYDMPLIRYSTGDLVKSDKDSLGIVNNFQITGGRNGDYIEDAKGRKYSLTFFLGRHHKIYDFADYVQLCQTARGKATYYLTIRKENAIDKSRLDDFFDIPDMDMQFDHVVLSDPILTNRGKLKLKLATEDVKELNK